MHDLFASKQDGDITARPSFGIISFILILQQICKSFSVNKLHIVFSIYFSMYQTCWCIYLGYRTCKNEVSNWSLYVKFDRQCLCSEQTWGWKLNNHQYIEDVTILFFRALTFVIFGIRQKNKNKKPKIVDILHFIFIPFFQEWKSAGALNK